MLLTTNLTVCKKVLNNAYLMCSYIKLFYNIICLRSNKKG